MSVFMLGIAGGTGSGKTTIARRIAGAVPSTDVTLLEHDSYYRDLSHLPAHARDSVNFDHPDALETELLIEQLRSLRSGAAVDVPSYDFASHTRRASVRCVAPTPLVVVEGILVLADERLRPLFDLKIYVDTDADVRLLRRLQRDIQERGRSFESVREQYDRSVRPMHLQFVEPSKRWADVIVPDGGENRAAIELLLGRVEQVLTMSQRGQRDDSDRETARHSAG
ncbi:MAG: uridine kinase [Polyangiaceae bacterium]